MSLIEAKNNINILYEEEYIMNENETRFKRVYLQHFSRSIIEIWVDKETGVNYIYRGNEYSGGLTILVDNDGKPVVTK